MTDELRQHHRRCAPHLTTLRVLAAEPGSVLLAPASTGAVERALLVVLAEAEAAQDTVVGAVAARGDGPSAAARFLSARLTRLRSAGDDVLAAAAAGDAPALRRRLWMFNSLAEAMWTVQISFWTVATPLLAAAGRERASRRVLHES
ncbi:hypothetical protein [Spirillospora sp. NPDC047279]|uniref:hypothetical protein n=1 Tax=Spirillospora sp. NPDC047279 TaxID=3155478 RepID=UPI0033C2F07A